MDHRWLLDENIDIRLAIILRALDRSAVHVTEYLWPSVEDTIVLGTAQREFDILLTSDLFRQQNEWNAARAAMIASLRIVRIRFRARQRREPDEQARALLWRLREIELVLTSRSEVRMVTLSGQDYEARFTTAEALQNMDGPQGVIR